MKLLLLMIMGVVTDPDLKVRLDPPQCLEPCNTAAHIEVSKEISLKSEFCIHASNSEATTGSCWPLELRGFSVSLKDFRRGNYIIEVSVQGLTNKQTLVVYGPGVI